MSQPWPISVYEDGLREHHPENCHTNPPAPGAAPPGPKRQGWISEDSTAAWRAQGLCRMLECTPSPEHTAEGRHQPHGRLAAPQVE